MADVIPAFREAMRDPALRGHPRDVYCWLHERLDVMQFRPVKAIEIQAALRLRKRSAYDAIDRLLAAGYVERGAAADRVWTYRLLYSRVPDSHQKSS